MLQNHAFLALGAGSRRFKSSRPDQPSLYSFDSARQPSLLNGVKNEDCRAGAKGESGPQQR